MENIRQVHVLASLYVNTNPRKKHVLCCEDHKNDPENSSLLENYKQENIHSTKIPLPDFSKEIKLHYHCDNNQGVYSSHLVDQSDGEVVDSSVDI